MASYHSAYFLFWRDLAETVRESIRLGGLTRIKNDTYFGIRHDGYDFSTFEKHVLFMVKKNPYTFPTEKEMIERLKRLGKMKTHDKQVPPCFETIVQQEYCHGCYLP